MDLLPRLRNVLIYKSLTLRSIGQWIIAFLTILLRWTLVLLPRNSFFNIHLIILTILFAQRFTYCNWSLTSILNNITHSRNLLNIGLRIFSTILHWVLLLLLLLLLHHLLLLKLLLLIFHDLCLGIKFCISLSHFGFFISKLNLDTTQILESGGTNTSITLHWGTTSPFLQSQVICILRVININDYIVMDSSPIIIDSHPIQRLIVLLINYLWVLLNSRRKLYLVFNWILWGKRSSLYFMWWDLSIHLHHLIIHCIVILMSHWWIFWAFIFLPIFISTTLATSTIAILILLLNLLSLLHLHLLLLLNMLLLLVLIYDLGMDNMSSILYHTIVKYITGIIVVVAIVIILSAHW